MKLINLKQNTKEWLDFRRNHVCASDAPIILDVSPYKKIDKLLDEKIKGYELVPNKWMNRGRDLEPLALEMFELQTGFTMFPMVAKHSTIDWMAASFDGVSIDQKHFVEIKCPGKKDHQLALEGKIPPKYIPQLQHQICVIGLDKGYYYSFDGKNGVIIEFVRDEKFIEIMIEKENLFWNHIQAFR